MKLLKLNNYTFTTPLSIKNLIPLRNSLSLIKPSAHHFALFLTQDISDLIHQIRQVLTGGVGMTDDLTTKLVTGLARRGSKSLNADLTEQESLTDREKEVLGLIAQGATNKEIAASLFISENTVRAHVRTLMQKLHLDNRTQLAVYGVHEGLTVNGRAGIPSLGASKK